MKKNFIPWFKFYPADFVNGVRGLSSQEVGTYILLLCRMYEESGPISDNLLRLSTYCGARETTFRKSFDKLVALGKLEVLNGKVSNQRATLEIASRANDLILCSQAGKKSAEKRQQNQQNSASTVPPSFKHIDTEIDTNSDSDSKNSTSEAQTRLPQLDFGSSELGSTVRERLLAAMGVGCDGIVSPRKFLGTQIDMVEAGQWMQLPGLSLEKICAEVSRIMATNQDGLPSRFSYFTAPMQRLSAASKTPPQQSIATKKPQRVRARLEGETFERPIQ